ncbi:MAG: hypothetical protein RJA44_2741 [Pseudomonadota bacterium]
MNRIPSAFYLGCLSLALAACSSTPKDSPAPVASAPAAVAAAPAPAAPVAQHQTPAAAAVPVAAAAPKALPPYLDPANELSRQRSVFFEFDRSVLKPEYTALIERHGRYLAANPAVAIRVEGNTDERGSAEYNLGLGQRRAQTVARALALLGVKPNQMDVVSWGEEKPRDAGHNDKAWAQNRRVDLQYPNK